MWVDPNLNDFYNRVSRIEKAHAKGYGFEARGTLGRSTVGNRRQVSLRFIKPLALVLLVAVGLKGMIHYFIGAEIYNERVQALSAGEGFDPVGGWLMQVDPASNFISAQLQATFPR